MTLPLGTFGVWAHYLAFTPELARELEQLGYGALWLGGSPPADLPVIEDLLAATESTVVGTSIVNIWSAPAGRTAESFHRIEARFPGRFLLGIGAGHPEATQEYHKPFDALVAYLDELDAAGVPKQSLALAALGPRVLGLAAQRTAGALPYLVTPEHTRQARPLLGDALLIPEQKVVLSDDPQAAREIGRKTVRIYLRLANYVSNLRRIGFTEADVAEQGSDRLIDALAVHGAAEEVAKQLRDHLDAGADHVAVQLLAADNDPLPGLRALAEVLF
jgi:probable F420-dependent oxidoreductase